MGPYLPRLRWNLNGSMASILLFITNLLEKSQWVGQGFDRPISGQNRNSKLCFSSKADLMTVRAASGLPGMLRTPRSRLGEARDPVFCWLCRPPSLPIRQDGSDTL